MRYAIIGVAAVVLLGVLAFVGYNVYRSLDIAKKGATGQPIDEAPPLTAVGDNPLSLPLRCLARADRRVRDGQAKYLGWVDAKAGPTCQEKHLRGVLTLHDDAPGICTRAAELARATARAELAERLEDVAVTYTSLNTTVREAEPYYAQQRYTGDACAQAIALHPRLVSGYEGTIAALDALRARVATDADTHNAWVRTQIVTINGQRSMPERVLELLFALDELAFLFQDGQIIDGELQGFEKAAQQVTSLTTRLTQDHAKTPLTKETKKFVDRSAKLVKRLRLAKTRMANGKALESQEWANIERELRSLLRDAGKVDQLPSPALLYVE